MANGTNNPIKSNLSKEDLQIIAYELDKIQQERAKQQDAKPQTRDAKTRRETTPQRAGGNISGFTFNPYFLGLLQDKCKSGNIDDQIYM